MKKISVEIQDEDLRAIGSFYGKSDEQTVDVVVFDTLNRYLNVEYFDPKLEIDD